MVLVFHGLKFVEMTRLYNAFNWPFVLVAFDVVMGPVEIMESIPPLQVLRIYMDARLPGFALPEPGRIKVILDPTQANHLRIFMSTADVRALRNAWAHRGNNAGSVKMEARGIDDGAGSYTPASGSGTSSGGNGFGLGRYSQAGSGYSGRSASARR
ncbi:hypothetical protein B0H19DRAFT_1058569 [Mycena capillaripes]|nr:hypothetical protein B0H19DRAFT_1058569 [Mycena capillaripes]